MLGSTSHLVKLSKWLRQRDLLDSHARGVAYMYLCKTPVGPRYPDQDGGRNGVTDCGSAQAMLSKYRLAL